MNEKAVVSSKGQVVIPLPIRNKLGLHAGSELIFELHGEIVEIKPVKHSIEDFFGCCKDEDQGSISIEEMDEAIMKAVSEKQKVKAKKRKGKV